MTDEKDTWRSEAGKVLALAWPVMLSSLSWTLMQLTDVVVIGQAGTYEVAAFGASRTLTFIAIVAGMAFLSGVLVNVSRADGAGKPEASGTYLREGIALALLSSLIIGAVLTLFGDALLRWIGVEASLIPLTGKVVWIMGLVIPVQMMAMPFGSFLQAIGRPRRTLAINCITLPLNAVLAWAWAGGHLGFSPMGAVGASWATLVASCVGLVLTIASCWFLDEARLRQVRRIGLIDWTSAVRGVPALAWFGTVPAIASALELGGFSWVMAKSTQMGLVASHAFQIVMSLHNVTFGFAMGFGAAAGVRVGNAVGAGQRQVAWQRTIIAGGLATVLIGVLAVILVILAKPLLALYPATDPVRFMAATMLIIWAPFMAMDGLQLVGSYALRSLGDQVISGVNSIIAFFFITIGVGMWLIHIGIGPMALIWAVGIGMLACAILQFARLWWIRDRREPAGLSVSPA